MSQLKLKRGTAAMIPALADGEPGWTTDTQRLYVGTPAGNVFVGPSAQTDSGTWNFSTTTTMADPGSGKLRVDNAAAAAVANIALSKTTAPGTDAANVLRGLPAGTVVYIQERDNAANWVRYKLTAMAIDNTTWFQLPVTIYDATSTGGALTNNAPLTVAFTRAGAGGGGAGTVTSVAAGTGLTASPSPITGSGTMGLAVPVSIANGGTGSTTQSAALTGLLPAQAGQAGKVLGTDGTAASWVLATIGVSEGRLTLSSGVPVPAGDVSGSTLYFTPHKGNRVRLYTGGAWKIYTFSEISLTLTAPAAGTYAYYDVWLYDSAGNPTLGLSAAWTNATTRADALATQDGVKVKSADHSRLWLGSVCLVGDANVCYQVSRVRFVYNAYNKVLFPVVVTDSTTQWTSTDTAWHMARLSSGNRLEVMLGDADNLLFLDGLSFYTSSVAGSFAGVAVAEDNITIPTSTTIARLDITTANLGFTVTCKLSKLAPLGYHYYQWLERACATGTTTFFGSLPPEIVSGLCGFILM